MYDYNYEKYPFFRANMLKYPSRKQQVGGPLRLAVLRVVTRTLLALRSRSRWHS